MTAKHTPSGDTSFRDSLLRNLGGGLALIALISAVFLGIGQIAGPGVPEVAGSPGDGDDADVAEESEEPAAPEEPEEPDDEATEGSEPSPEPEEPGADDDGADDDAGEDEGADDDAGPVEDGADGEVDGDGSDEDGDAESDEEPDGESGQESGAVAPGDISVQVLDGVGTDGGSAADRVATELGDAGFRVVAQNPALAYDVTTVMWTSGNEQRARQVAAEIGAAEVRAQPGNLSESVDVHVVVGADRA